MESYAQFTERINSFEKPVLNLGEGDFSTNSSVKDKFDSNNKFRRFYGDTTVFDLSPDIKDKLNLIVDTLYGKAKI